MEGNEDKCAADALSPPYTVKERTYSEETSALIFSKDLPTAVSSLEKRRECECFDNEEYSLLVVYVLLSLIEKN